MGDHLLPGSSACMLSVWKYDLSCPLRGKYVGIVGSVVECSPATRAARVRFPDDADYFGIWLFRVEI